LNNPARISIVEDDFVIAQELKVSVQSLGYEVLHLLDNGEDLLTNLAIQKPDLVLLDIQLAGKIDGISLAEQLKTKYQLPFVFLTAQTDRLTLDRAKLTEPQAYLVKPFRLPELQATLEITLHKLSQKSQSLDNELVSQESQTYLLNNQLFVKSKNRLEKVNVADILWLEARDIYSIIKTLKTQYVVSQSLKTLENQLPSDNFMRIHRSYLVALDKIEAIEDNSLVIANEYIPIGKTHKDNLLKHLRIL
jgi:DNA-binding LytR/AlgR family response regulator